jgi:MoxR-like ATPase
MFPTPEATAAALAAHDYVADTQLALPLYLALQMGKPLFLEGEPGVGKTEIAKVVARALDTSLIRLQCYEGIDVAQAVYEWNYTQQLLALQSREIGADTPNVYTEQFLLKRPLLKAIDAGLTRAPVLLIDELDRADEEFESFLLELLSDFQITIPELGTLKASHRPVVILTSNRTREIHDALKRRCVYCWIDYPSPTRELEIVMRKSPGLSETLARQIVAFIQRVRTEDLFKAPGVAETLDWAQALHLLNMRTLDAATVQATLGFVLKYQDDVDKLRGQVETLVAEAVAG